MHSDDVILAHFVKKHPQKAAQLLERQPQAEVVALLADMRVDLAADIFGHLERFIAVQCLEALASDRGAAIIDKLPLEVTAMLLRRVEVEKRGEILQDVPRDTADRLQRILQYAENSAGALMDPLVFTLPEDITVNEAIRRVRQRPQHLLYYLYVVTRAHQLAGVLNMRELMLANPDMPIASVLNREVVALSPDVSYQAVLDHPGWQDYHAMPVVDNAGRFLGAIRYESLRHIERSLQRRRVSRPALMAGSALGDLYRIGLAGLVRGTAEASAQRKK